MMCYAEAEGLSLSRSNTEAGSINGDIAEPGDMDRHPAIAPGILIAIPAPIDIAKGPPSEQSSHTRPAASVRVKSVTKAGDLEGTPPPTAATDMVSVANRAFVATNGTLRAHKEVVPTAEDATAVSNEVPRAATDSLLTAKPASVATTKSPMAVPDMVRAGDGASVITNTNPTAATDTVPSADRISVATNDLHTAAMDTMITADRAFAAINGTDNGGAARQSGPVSPMVAPGQPLLTAPTQAMPIKRDKLGSPVIAPGPPSLSAPVRAMPLPVYLQLAAYQVRALKGTISQQQEGWTRQLNSVEKQALLETACQVLSSASTTV